MSSLQLDFAVTISALLGIPFPYGRCSVSTLSNVNIVYSCLIYFCKHIINCNVCIDSTNFIYFSITFFFRGCNVGKTEGYFGLITSDLVCDVLR